MTRGADGGGRSGHSALSSRPCATLRPVLSNSTASSARGLGGTGTDSPLPARASTDPSTKNLTGPLQPVRMSRHLPMTPGGRKNDLTAYYVAIGYPVQGGAFPAIGLADPNLEAVTRCSAAAYNVR